MMYAVSTVRFRDWVGRGWKRAGAWISERGRRLLPRRVARVLMRPPPLPELRQVNGRTVARGRVRATLRGGLKVETVAAPGMRAPALVALQPFELRLASGRRLRVAARSPVAMYPEGWVLVYGAPSIVGREVEVRGVLATAVQSVYRPEPLGDPTLQAPPDGVVEIRLVPPSRGPFFDFVQRCR